MTTTGIFVIGALEEVKISRDFKSITIEIVDIGDLGTVRLVLDGGVKPGFRGNKIFSSLKATASYPNIVKDGVVRTSDGAKTIISGPDKEIRILRNLIDECWSETK